jgi:glycosyltransferase involved in cell wall biosynthesis
MDQARFPLVTIITPVFNAEAYIGETVESVLAQDYPRLEHIVLDDGSTDASREIVRGFADPRLRLVHHENIGEAATVNCGLALAEGDIIGVVNADDPILPGLVGAAVEMLDAHPELAAVYPDWRRIDAAGAAIADMIVPEYDYRVLLEQNLCLPGPGALVRRAALGDEPLRDPRFRYKSDYFLWLRLGLHHPLARLPGIYATWRQHSASASQHRRSSPLMASEHLAVVEAVFARPDCPDEVRRWRRLTRSVACYCAGLLSIHNPAIPGRELLLRSLALAPMWPSRFLPERRRAWSRILYVLGCPFSEWAYRAALPFDRGWLPRAS